MNKILAATIITLLSCGPVAFAEQSSTTEPLEYFQTTQAKVKFEDGTILDSNDIDTSRTVFLKMSNAALANLEKICGAENHKKLVATLSLQPMKYTLKDGTIFDLTKEDISKEPMENIMRQIQDELIETCGEEKMQEINEKPPFQVLNYKATGATALRSETEEEGQKRLSLWFEQASQKDCGTKKVIELSKSFSLTKKDDLQIYSINATFACSDEQTAEAHQDL